MDHCVPRKKLGVQNIQLCPVGSFEPLLLGSEIPEAEDALTTSNKAQIVTVSNFFLSRR